MNKKVYLYEIELGKDHKYCAIKEFDLIAENKNQYVIEGAEFYIRDKKKVWIHLYTNETYLYSKKDMPFYKVTYFTTEKNERSKKIVINALKKEAAKMCFLNDEINNMEFNFKE